MKWSFKEFKGEFRKIIWPSKDTLVKQTTTVIVISLFSGLVIAGIDFIFGAGVNFISNLF